MSLRTTIATAISRWLCPTVHREAERFDRMRGQIDDARWWLGATHPEAASLAEYILRSDSHYWGDEPSKIRNAWAPPEWCWGIPNFRSWLDTKPFVKASASPPDSLRPSP